MLTETSVGDCLSRYFIRRIVILLLLKVSQPQMEGWLDSQITSINITYNEIDLYEKAIKNETMINGDNEEHDNCEDLDEKCRFW